MISKTTLVLLVVAALAVAVSEARPKRSVILAAAPVAVASVPVVHTAPAATVVHSHVVHQNPTSVVSITKL